MHSTPSRVGLRAAESSDLAALERLLTQSGLSTKGVADALRHFTVAIQDDRMVGTVGLEIYGSDALLRSAAVSDQYRGTGVGRMLVQQILANAAQQGIGRVFLLTTTAEHWFPRFGFERIAREEVPDLVTTSVEFREICPASAIVMVKHLR